MILFINALDFLHFFFCEMRSLISPQLGIELLNVWVHNPGEIKPICDLKTIWIFLIKSWILKS